MLPRLRHRPFVRRHDEQREVHPARTREHVLDEPLVPRHIHDADLPPGRQRQPREPEVDRQSPLFLFPQPVGIDACQGADKRALPVVNMPCGPNDIHG